MEQFSGLIGDIYDASLDPALWPEVFDNIRKFVGCAFGRVVLQDAIGRTTSLYLASTHDAHYRQLYLEKYFKINPLFPMVLFSEIEQTLTIPDVLPREEFARTRFVREWLAPQGLIDILFTSLEKSAIACTFVSAIRHARQGLFDAEVRQRLELVVPHIRRAVHRQGD